MLKATREVPKRLQNPKRKTIGIRVPDNAIALALLEELGEPLMSTSLILPGNTMAESDPDVIRDNLEKQVGLVADHPGEQGGVVLVFHDFTAGKFKLRGYGFLVIVIKTLPFTADLDTHRDG